MRIGIGLSLTRLSGGAWSPADIPDCDLAHLWDGATLYTTDGGTTVAALDDPVGRLKATRGVGPDGVQSSSALRPTRKADGLQFDPVDDRLSFSTVTLAGDYTVYLTGTRAGGGWFPLVNTATQGAFTFQVASGYVQDDAGNFWNLPSLPTGGLLLRIRRASGVTYFARTGAAEISSPDVTGTISVGTAGYWGVYAIPNGDAANRYRDRLIYSRDLTAGERSRVEAYFAAQGYSLE